MAFSYTTSSRDAAGEGIITGTFNASGVTSGTIATGLNNISYFGTSATSASPNFPQVVATGGSVAISGLASGQTGYWIAKGY